MSSNNNNNSNGSASTSTSKNDHHNHAQVEIEMTNLSFSRQQQPQQQPQQPQSLQQQPESPVIALTYNIPITTSLKPNSSHPNLLNAGGLSSDASSSMGGSTSDRYRANSKSAVHMARSQSQTNMHTLSIHDLSDSSQTHKHSHSHHSHSQSHSGNVLHASVGVHGGIRDDASVSFHDTYNDNQQIHQHPDIGLTSVQASTKLVNMIETLLTEKEQENPFNTWKVLRQQVLRITTLIYILAVALLVVAFALQHEHFQALHLIVEAGLLLLFLILHLFMRVREERLEHNEVIAKARGHLRHYLTLGDVLEHGVTSSSESISDLSVCRDDLWRKVPLNLLVEGDHISLREGERVPVMLQCAEPMFKSIVLHRGDTYSSDLLVTRLLEIKPNIGEKERQQVKEMSETLFTSGRSCFVVSETPSFPQLVRATLGSAGRPANPVINAINYIRIVVERFLWAAVAISLVANIIRAVLQKDRLLVDVLIIRQVDLVIAFSFVMLPSILLLVAYSLGHAKLLALFDVLQERSLKGEISDDHPALNFDREYNDDHLPKVPFKLMKNYWEAILSSKHVAFSHSSNLLHHIASTTVICCIDKEGIVSEPVSTVGELCYLRGDGPVRLELSSEYSHTQYSISFNDQDWQEHLNALKPMGLNCLLNKTCRLYSGGDSNGNNSNSISGSRLSTLPNSFNGQRLLSDHVSKIQLIKDREESNDTTNSQCLCLLAKEIGFSDEVSNQFVNLKTIHTLTQRSVKGDAKASDDDSSKDSPSMISLVAKDMSETLQLLSKGSTDLILEHCNQYWDGTTILPFGEEEKEKVRAINNKWLTSEGMKCISFAYAPIDSKYNKLFATGSINSPLVDVRFSNSTMVRRKKQDLRMQMSKRPQISTPDAGLKVNSIVVNSPITSNSVSSQSQIKMTPKKTDPEDDKSEVVIFVESPIPSGKQSPILLKNTQDNINDNNNGNNNNSAKKKKKKTKFLKPYKKKSSKNKEDKEKEKEKDTPPSIDLDISSITQTLSLPPVELEYESGDDSQHASNNNNIANDNDNNDPNNNNPDNIVVMDGEIEDEHDGTHNHSEYTNNDSETESDSPKPAKIDQHQQHRMRRLSNETSSYSVSETSESDSFADKKRGKHRSNDRYRRSKFKKQQQQQMSQMAPIADEAQHNNQQTEEKSTDAEQHSSIIIVDNSATGGEIAADQDSSSHAGISKAQEVKEAIAENETLEKLQDGQIFIGMAGMRVLPKSHVNHFVEVLTSAGIRFVYFSSEDRRTSNPFVNRLGLETDWNCCVSLKDPEHDEEQQQDGPSRLPKGIAAIRKHLDEVDNVPLLVPMFSNSTPETKLEMIKILQENGEVVCCIGSSLNYENTPIFCQSDLAFSLEPAVSRCLNLPLNRADPRPLLTSRNFFETESITHLAHLPIKTTDTKRVPTENPSTQSLCCDITSLPCSLVFHRRTDFNEILEFFHVGRQQLTNTRQCLQFILSASMTLVLMCLVAGVLVVSMPRDGVVGGVPLTGLQIMWLQFIIIPLVGFSLLATSEDEDVMKTLSPKNNQEFTHIPTFAKYIAIRLVPSLLLTVWLFIWCLHSLSDASWGNIFGASISDWPTNPRITYSDALFVSQNIMMFAFVYYLSITSLSFIHHTQSVLKFNPLRKNYIWVIAALLSIGLQVGFSLVSLKAIDGIGLLGSIPWELYVVLFCWAIVVILLDEFVKRLYKKWFDEIQLELRLEFDTKLGMHSPI
ncbi:hypothetical protein SAMD00019534_005540 [Acytostelium subglobosum LB1]|uniref:hypothetical protein n=1 Tax=Acytostelium subglobosum LB1 TaxID=1410327 RepID=UPI000644F2E2|nr:hypothetical protein SAMD00019534_005540 [Acytostelium subglobosum LB1]GAM17379.1 hypothetical protein SAMD00019534_005540 [Acytostelium subglobosum LB1]|eukprot:XP_012759441.1 hypothetical protein SAMD00019534_005540 [Acytostelium subglobosum LB1]